MAEMPGDTIDQALRSRFQSAWLAGRPEPIERLLPAEDDPCYLTVLEDLVHAELQLAWRSWTRAMQQGSTAPQDQTIARPSNVEGYLRRFPRLNRPEIVVRLAAQECAARRECGEDASLDEYRRRFPEAVVSEEDSASSLPMVSQTGPRAAMAETLATGPLGGTAPGTAAPADFGNYESLVEIGRGGMGVVYRARQRTADRVVALKVIRRDRLDQLPADTQSTALDRFRHEAQAAARLEHENIVTVYEVGQVEGQPFFSMRYVEGRSLSEILREGPMENRRAAGYLEPVARALGEAHCQGILHRDLKPQNILVDKKTNRALVADFGLAKLSEGSDEITRAGEIMGTPSYMSPEQARDSASVTAKTDIYSLGATLYHMLTARPPFQAATPVETLRQVIDEEPAPPRRLNPSIDRDLETVCLKCLHKEPTRRYESAEALADDLRRYLRGEPILARPIGTPGRVWRWCRRNPGLATAVALAVTFFALALVGTSVGYVRASAARRQAEESFNQAQAAVDDFLTLVGEETLLNEPGMQPLRRKLLAKARDYYQRFLVQRGGDPSIRDAVALAHFRVGLATEKINSPEEALASFRRARDMQVQLVAEHPDDPDRLASLGNTWTAIAAALIGQGKPSEARDAHLEAIEIRVRAADRAPPGESEPARTLANSHMNLGRVEMNLGLVEQRPEEKQRLYQTAGRELRQAQQIREDLLARLGDSPKTRRDLAMGHFNLACLAMARGEAEPAEKSLDEAIAVFTQLLEEDPEVLANQGDLATCHRLMGDLMSGLGRPEPARESYRKALEQIDALARANPAVPSYQSALAGLHMNVGQLEGEQDRPDEAQAAFRRAREILEPLVNRYPEVPQYRRSLAVTLREAALLKSKAGEYEAAREDLQLAQRQLNELLRSFPDSTEYLGQLAQTKAALDAMPSEPPQDQ